MKFVTVNNPEEIGLSKERLEVLREKLLKEIENEVCDGVVMIVARKGKIGFYEAVGLADKENGKKLEKDDIFHLMSLSKAFTAAEVLRLADVGVIGLHDKVSRYVPEYATKGKDNVTIYQLLSHTGGAWSYLFGTPGMMPGDECILEKCVKGACGMTLTNFPGTRARYTPWAGFAVLGEIIRRVHGGNKRFADIIAENWFKPLGMKDSEYGFHGSFERRVPVILREKAEGAGDAAGFAAFNKYHVGDAEMPGGNAHGTAEDCLTFVEMLRNGGNSNGKQYLSPAMVKYAYRNHTGDLPNDFWDYSKVMRDIPQYPANFTIGGGYARGEGDFFTPHANAASPTAFAAIGGGSTMMMFDPEKELSVVFLAAGLNEGLAHFKRLNYINNLVYSSLL